MEKCRDRPPPRPDFTAVTAARRRNMAAIRGAGTKPEMLVRRTAHALGYRFRLHVKDLPGRPDLVFPGRRKVIFVHGCFWHRHGCRYSVLPKARREFLCDHRTAAGLSRARCAGRGAIGPRRPCQAPMAHALRLMPPTAARDRRDQEALQALGWMVLVLWECDLSDAEELRQLICDFLGPTPSTHTSAVVASEVTSPSRPNSSGGGAMKAP